MNLSNSHVKAILYQGRESTSLMTRQQPVWMRVAVPDWLPLDKACAAAQSGRLIAQVRHRQMMLSLDGARG